MLILYLPTGDFFVVNNEPVGYWWRQFDSLDPETNMTFLQNLIVETVFQRNNYTKKQNTKVLILDHKRNDDWGVMLRHESKLTWMFDGVAELKHCV